MSSYQMMRSKLIASRESLENFQFVTINGKIIFSEKERVVRIARAYSQVVKSAIGPLFNGKSIDELTKDFYNILPNYVYLETALKQAKTIVDGLLDKEEEMGKILHAKIRKFWLGSRGNKNDKGNRNIKFHVLEDHVEVRLEILGASGFMGGPILAGIIYHYFTSWRICLKGRLWCYN